MSITDELTRLADLRDRGALTAEEFESQKARLLRGPSTLDAEDNPGRPESFRGRNRPLWVVGAAILVVLVIIMLAHAGSSSQQPNTTVDAPAEPAPVKVTAVTAVQLAQAYDDNEAAAQRDYGGRPLLVTGTIAGVDLDIVDNPVVQLNGTNDFLHVQANLVDDDKPRAGDLHKGHAITLLCQDVSEVLSAPILKDCSIRTAADTTIKVDS